MTAPLIDQIATLRTQMTDLIARGFTPDDLTAHRADWDHLRAEVEVLCAHIKQADPKTAYAVIDDLRDMVGMLEGVSFLKVEP